MQSSAPIHQHWWPATSTRSAVDRRARSVMVYDKILDAVAVEYRLCRSQLLIQKSARGKPVVMQTADSGTRPVERCHISVSHCRQLSVWMIQNRPCAVDIEPITASRTVDRLLKRLLSCVNDKHDASQCRSPEIGDQVSLLSLHERTLLFYRLWTYFESWCKWHGLTLWQTFQLQIPFPWPSVRSCLSGEPVLLGPRMLISYRQLSNDFSLCVFSTPH